MTIQPADDPLAVLRRLLAELEPFSALDEAARERLVAAAEVGEHRAGELVLDGFRSPSLDVLVVLAGRVGLWHEVESYGQPDETVRAGGFFGFSAMLTGRPVGPRARALTQARVARIGKEAAEAAFVTPAGARFLADHLLTFAEQARMLPGFATTASLVAGEPVVVRADEPLGEVARQLTERRLPGVVVELGGGAWGLVTDGSIRRRVMVEGLPTDATAGDALARGVPIVQGGDSAGEVLIEVLDAQTDAAVVTDRRGRLQGVVGLREFALSPTTADVALHEQLRLASSREELVQRVRQTPDVLARLLAQGLSGEKVIRVHSGLIDTVVRRAIELCLAEHEGLAPDGFTWLALGSNGRREAVLSSDVESAVVFPDSTDEHLMAQYLAVFREVDVLLGEAGLAGDRHGVSARNRVLARTITEWREAVTEWLGDPHKDKGAIMISLLVDSRPVFGDPSLGGAGLGVQNLREHPLTMRLLLSEALAAKAKGRPRDVPWRRQAVVDIKHDALLPLVNLARWVGLAVRTDHLATPDRLRAAAGTALVAKKQAPALAESFEMVQRLRLRCQLRQVQEGQPPSDVVELSALSPIDRSVLDEAVHEIAVAQRRLANVAAWSETDDWQLPGSR